MPHGHSKTTTLAGALRLTGMTAPFVYDGAMNGNVFLAYVEQLLSPTLQTGDVVVMDNLTTHKAAGARYDPDQTGSALTRNSKKTRRSTNAEYVSLQYRKYSKSNRQVFPLSIGDVYSIKKQRGPHCVR